MPPIQEIIKQLREVEGRATKDWEHTNAGVSVHDKEKLVCENMSESEEDEVRHINNCDLIVLMRNNLIPLLDRLEELEREKEEDAKFQKDLKAFSLEWEKLRKIQLDNLGKALENFGQAFGFKSDCLHDKCSECQGTGQGILNTVS